MARLAEGVALALLLLGPAGAPGMAAGDVAQPPAKEGAPPPWLVTRLRFPDGSRACEALHVEGRARLAIWQTGPESLGLQLFDPRWTLPRGRLPVVLRISPGPVIRLAAADAARGSILVPIRPGAQARRLRVALARGWRLGLEVDGRRLAVWSLAGSAAALDRLAQCARTLDGG